MVDPKEVSEKVKWYQQFDFELEAIYGDDYIPTDPVCPDVEKYYIKAYNDESGTDILYTYDDENRHRFYNAVIKELKKIKGMKDPWDTDPEYIEKNNQKENDTITAKIENSLKDPKGNYYLLKINESSSELNSNEFFPEIISKPDACRYTVYTNDPVQNIAKTIYFRDVHLKDLVVKQLKKIHGLNDPWDENPEMEIRWQERWENQRNAQAEHIQKLNDLKVIELGANQVGERHTRTYFASKDEDELRELWPNWIEFMDRKVVAWTEKVQPGEDVLQDRLVILEKRNDASDQDWFMIYQRWYRKYIIQHNGEKKWINAKANGIEKFEFYYDINLRVRFLNE